METGIETTYKVGDKVIATTPYMGEKKERDGIIRDVQPNKYAAGFTHRVEVVVAGDTTYYWLTADKLRLAQTPAIHTEGEVTITNNSNQFIAVDIRVLEPPATDDFEDVPIRNVEYLTLPEIEALAKGQLSESDMSQLAQVVDPPKKRIRRSNEEQALGIPLDQILAYRADPEGWLKKEREATESFHEVIEQAVESHWEDKAKEILEPEETGRQVFERLGWKRIADDSDATIAYTWDSVRIDVEYETLKCTIGGETLYFHQQEGWTLERYIKAVMAIWARNMNGQQTCVVGEETELYAPPADDTLQSIREELNPSQESPEQIIKRLGWEEYGQEHGESIYCRIEDVNGEVLLCEKYGNEQSIWVLESNFGGKYTAQYDPIESFEMWLVRNVERIEELLDGGVCDDNDLEGDDKPAEAVVSKTEITEPDWDKCMKAVRDDMEQFGPKPDVKFIQTTKVNGERFYVTVEPDSPMPQFYPSATNIVGTTMRMDEEILKWMVDKFPSYDAYKEELSMLAAKGSVMHGLFADAINAAVSKLGLPKYTEYEKWNSYFNVAWARQGYPHLAARWHKWMLKALQSFMKWVLEYEVIFVAVEIPMRSKRMKVAGQIDVICTMLESPRKTSRSDEERDLGKRTKTAMESGKKKGLEGDALAAHVMNAASKPYKPREPKRILALVDFKSGGAKESHYPQMAVYLQMVRENYPSLVQKLHHVFVWAPIKTGWKKEPTYSFKDVSKLVGIYMERQLPQMIHLARERAVDMDKETVLVMEGSPELGMAPEYRHIPLAEYWMERIQAGDFGERDLEISENPDEEQEDDEDGNE